MKHRLILLIIFLVLRSNLIGQTVLTGIVADSLNNPLPFASVYLSKTTMGTLTDNTGAYTINIPQNSTYELIVSCIGYKSHSQIISAEGGRQRIDVRLSVNLIMLNEVTVRSREKNWLNNYSQFVKMFLGETANSQTCKIKNPGDLHLYLDSDMETLKGFSFKPLNIENRALGYNIIYDLTDFSYNPRTGLLRFSGNHYFQNMKASQANARKWKRNRLNAYYGSRMHFMRSLFSNSLVPENFKIFEYEIVDSAKKELALNKPLQADDLRLSYDKISSCVFFNKPVMIYFKDNHPELSGSLTGYKPLELISTILFSDTVNVYSNGYYDNLYSITWGGEMADERIGDLLPFDFQPDNSRIEINDSDAVLNPVDKYLLSEQNSRSQDQIFVHLDRNMYKPGDTIYFQAYIRNRFTGEFETNSVSLYALLFNEEKKTVDSSRFKIGNSLSSGWMTIPPKAEPGQYHFAAFTSMMQNYRQDDAFHSELKVRRIKRAAEEASKKDESVDSITADSIVKNEFFSLRFLPEGGNLVKGVEQRIGFNAVNISGEPVWFEGLLKDTSGLILDTIRSGPYGPGFFICNPRSGMYVEVTRGTEKEKIWRLPDPVEAIACLSVRQEGKRSFAAEIQSSDYSGEKVILSGSMNLTQIFYQEIVLDKKQRIIINTDQLPSGIVQVTLFTKEMRPVAERLLYVNSDKNLKFTISKGSDISRPGQETELTISVTDGNGQPAEGLFSISVSDSLSGHDVRTFIPGIEYTFNYNPYFPANLPSEVLSQGLDNISDEDRDLLLMVYGWSRYNWDFSQEKSIPEEQINYDLLKMKILYTGKNHRSDRRLDLVSLEGPSIKHLLTNSLGEISLPLDSLPDITRSFTLMPDPKNKKRVTGAMFSIPYNENFFRSSLLLKTQPAFMSNSFRMPEADQKVSLGEEAIEIPEVIIKANPGAERLYHDKYEETYQYADIKSLDYELLWSSANLADAVRRLIAPYIMNDNIIVLRPPRSFFGGAVPALVVLDGMPIYGNGWSYVRTISTSDVTSLTILPGGQASFRYGMSAAGGVIFINTRSSDPSLQKAHTEWKLQHSDNKMLLPISLYRREKDFYAPSRTEIDIDPILKARATILWDPQVYFNGKDPVSYQVYQSDASGTGNRHNKWCINQ